MLTDPLLAPVRLLEVSHVAHRLSASPWFVRQLIRSHQLPAIRIGTRWRVDPRDLEGFINARRVAALQQAIATHEAALDPTLGIKPRGRDGPREVGRAS
jgi:excisionase family DNA binding protein